MPVTVTNTSGADLLLYTPSGAAGSFNVADGDAVEVPGVVLDEDEDHYLIGPEGSGVDDDAVRAWPKATWQVTTRGDTSDA
jgi:hypothetical protein